MRESFPLEVKATHYPIGQKLPARIKHPNSHTAILALLDAVMKHRGLGSIQAVQDLFRSLLIQPHNTDPLYQIEIEDDFFSALIFDQKSRTYIDITLDLTPEAIEA